MAAQIEGENIRVGGLVKFTNFVGPSKGWTIKELDKEYPGILSGKMTKQELIQKIKEVYPQSIVYPFQQRLPVVGREEKREEKPPEKVEIALAPPTQEDLIAALEEGNREGRERKQIELEPVPLRKKKRGRAEGETEVKPPKAERESLEFSGLLYRGKAIEPEGKVESPETRREKEQSPLWFSFNKSTAFIYAPRAGEHQKPTHQVEVWETKTPLLLVILNPTNLRNLVHMADQIDEELGIIPDPTQLETRIRALLLLFPTGPPIRPNQINHLLDRVYALVSALSEGKLRSIFESTIFKHLFPTLKMCTSYVITNLIKEQPYLWYSLPQLMIKAFGQVGDRQSFKIIDAAIAMWMCSLQLDGFIAGAAQSRKHAPEFHEEIVVCGQSRDKIKLAEVVLSRKPIDTS